MFGFGDKRMPTVKFDPTKVTPEVEADLKAVIKSAPDIPEEDRARIFCAALKGTKRGGDLKVIADALSTLPLLSKKRIAEICHDMNRRSRSIMDRATQTKLGLQAKWLYSGAPCGANDTAHKVANGQQFDPATGMLIEGRRVWPGKEPGCKCVSKSVIPGFD